MPTMLTEERDRERQRERERERESVCVCVHPREGTQWQEGTSSRTVFGGARKTWFVSGIIIHFAIYKATIRGPLHESCIGVSVSCFNTHPMHNEFVVIMMLSRVFVMKKKNLPMH